MGSVRGRRSASVGPCRARLMTALIAAVTVVGIANLRRPRVMGQGPGQPIVLSTSEHLLISDSRKNSWTETSITDFRGLQSGADAGSHDADSVTSTSAQSDSNDEDEGIGGSGSVLRHGSMAAAQRIFGSSTARGSPIGGSSSGITSGSAVPGRDDSVVSGLSNMLGSADGAAHPGGVSVGGGASAVAQKLKPLGLYFAKEARAAAAGGIAADSAVAPSRSSSLSGGSEGASAGGSAVGARPGSIADGLTNVLASGSGSSGEAASGEGGHGSGGGTPKPKPLGQYFEKDARAATTSDALSSGTDPTGDRASGVAPSHSAADAAYTGSSGGGIASENSGIGAAGLAASPGGVAAKAKPLGLYFEKDARVAVEAPALGLQRAVLRQLAARQRARKHGRARQKALGAYFAANAADAAAQGSGDAANAPAPAYERRLQGPEGFQQTARLAASQGALQSTQRRQQRLGRRRKSRPLGAYFAGDASSAVVDMMQPAPLPPLPEAVPPAPGAQLPRGDRHTLQGAGQRSQREHGRGAQLGGREISLHDWQQGSPRGSQHASAAAQQAVGGLGFRQQVAARKRRVRNEMLEQNRVQSA